MSQVPPPPPFNPSPSFGPSGSPAFAEHPKGTRILVFGILSILCCMPLGVAALVMGTKALAEIDANPSVTYSNRGKVAAGRVLGIVGIAVWALAVFYNVALR